MNENDERVIRHIARYRVGLRPIFSKLIFDGNESAMGNSIARLTKRERIEIREGLNRYNFYTLTPGEARRLNLPESRATLFDNDTRGQALHRWITSAWFCCLGEQRRKLLTDGEVQEFLGYRDTQVSYCTERQADGSVCIYRLYTPVDTGKLPPFLSRVLRDIKEARQRPSYDAAKPTLAQLIDAQVFRIGVIVGNDERRNALNRLIEQSDDLKELRAKVLVETCVTPLTRLSRKDDQNVRTLQFDDAGPDAVSEEADGRRPDADHGAISDHIQPGVNDGGERVAAPGSVSARDDGAGAAG